MKKPKLTYFESVQDAVNYGVSELLDSLRDDYNRMTHDKYERLHYKPSDREEMRCRINDLRKCESMMRNSSYVDEMYSLLLEMDKWLEKTRKRRTAAELLENLQPRIKKVVAGLNGHPDQTSAGATG